MGRLRPRIVELLNHCLGNLFVTVEEYYELELKTVNAGSSAESDENEREWRRILYSVSPSNNEYSRDLEAAVQVAQEMLRPHLK